MFKNGLLLFVNKKTYI